MGKFLKWSEFFWTHKFSLYYNMVHLNWAGGSFTIANYQISNWFLVLALLLATLAFHLQSWLMYNNKWNSPTFKSLLKLSIRWVLYAIPPALRWPSLDIYLLWQTVPQSLPPLITSQLKLQHSVKGLITKLQQSITKFQHSKPELQQLTITWGRD